MPHYRIPGARILFSFIPILITCVEINTISETYVKFDDGDSERTVLKINKVSNKLSQCQQMHKRWRCFCCLFFCAKSDPNTPHGNDVIEGFLCAHLAKKDDPQPETSSVIRLVLQETPLRLSA